MKTPVRTSYCSACSHIFSCRVPGPTAGTPSRNLAPPLSTRFPVGNSQQPLLDSMAYATLKTSCENVATLWKHTATPLHSFFLWDFVVGSFETFFYDHPPRTGRKYPRNLLQELSGTHGNTLQGLMKFLMGSERKLRKFTRWGKNLDFWDPPPGKLCGISQTIGEDTPG